LMRRTSGENLVESWRSIQLYSPWLLHLIWLDNQTNLLLFLFAPQHHHLQCGANYLCWLATPIAPLAKDISATIYRYRIV
jgi:hypothetical protein